MAEFTVNVDAVLLAHSRDYVWFRVPTRRQNGGIVVDAMGGTAFRGLTYPADMIEGKPGEYPKGTTFRITTDNAEVIHNGHGFRLAGGIGSIEVVEVPAKQEATDDAE